MFPAQFRYLASGNISVMLQAIPTLGVISLGVGMLMIAGEFDLSVGSVYTFASIAAAALLNDFSVPAWIGLLAAVAFGSGDRRRQRIDHAWLRPAVIHRDAGRDAVLARHDFAHPWRPLDRFRAGPGISGGVRRSRSDCCRQVSFGSCFSASVFTSCFSIDASAITCLRSAAIATPPMRSGSGRPRSSWSRSPWPAEWPRSRAYSAPPGSTASPRSAAQASNSRPSRHASSAVFRLSGGRGSVLGIFLGAALIYTIQDVLLLLRAPGFYLDIFVGALIVGAAILNQVAARSAQR